MSKRYNYKTYGRAPRANGFLTFLLSLFTIIFLFLFIIFFVMRSANAASIIRNTDLTWVLEETGISYDVIDIIEQVNELSYIETEIDIAAVEDFLQSNAVSEELGSIIDGYARAFVAGDMDHSITTRDIVDITRNLEPEINELFDRSLTEADFQHIEMILDETIDFSEFTVSSIIEEFYIDMTIPHLLISNTLLWIVGIISAFFLLLLVLHHRRSTPDIFLFTGIPIIIAGLLVFAMGLLVRSSPLLLGDLIYDYYEFYEALRFLGGPLQLIIQHGLLFAVFGTICVVFSALKRRTSENK